MKKMIVAANWKMNKTPQETMGFIKEFKSAFRNKPGRDLIFFPSFLSLPVFKQEFGETPISYGAQNCNAKDSGALTGEVSVAMLKEYGIKYCLVGHSERRTIFNETDEDVAQKTKTLQTQNVTPVVCIGETEAERTQGVTLQVIERQLNAVFATASAQWIVAYEPVWAIGTGKVPTIAEITEVHEFIRQLLVKKYSQAGVDIPILYGGSVNPQNARDIEAVSQVNGFLIGGASLKVASLLEIY